MAASSPPTKWWKPRLRLHAPPSTPAFAYEYLTPNGHIPTLAERRPERDASMYTHSAATSAASSAASSRRASPMHPLPAPPTQTPYVPYHPSKAPATHTRSPTYDATITLRPPTPPSPKDRGRERDRERIKRTLSLSGMKHSPSLLRKRGREGRPAPIAISRPTIPPIAQAYLTPDTTPYTTPYTSAVPSAVPSTATSPAPSPRHTNPTWMPPPRPYRAVLTPPPTPPRSFEHPRTPPRPPVKRGGEVGGLPLGLWGVETPPGSPDMRPVEKKRERPKEMEGEQQREREVERETPRTSAESVAPPIPPPRELRRKPSRFIEHLESDDETPPMPSYSARATSLDGPRGVRHEAPQTQKTEAVQQRQKHAASRSEDIPLARSLKDMSPARLNQAPSPVGQVYARNKPTPPTPPPPEIPGVNPARRLSGSRVDAEVDEVDDMEEKDVKKLRRTATVGGSPTSLCGEVYTAEVRTVRLAVVARGGQRLVRC
ncbi:hypothetical protein EJ06DRAFT_420794 [Trichodelitschia bisporula]|uniref:Uncharacterized protein n=1 Tax=Trichodelitschia bisporula TaxID=703511 RepID=A0A6G1HVX8_9PEZI|nr:hypothetical protein EJ06DRAFT_420794 [Trichodelitschia bisporula]